MVEGGAIASIASVAGMGWLANLATVLELVRTPDFEAARAWCEADPRRIANAYGISKEAINAYTADRCVELAERGLRINCLNPGPTDTPMMPHFEAANGVEFMRDFPKPIGRNSSPEEQAWPLLFLNSPRASYVTGTALFADGGFTGALHTGHLDVTLLVPPSMR
jgi:NAD(P)-dependent dehydrogenase (short-subunit alcohol dehydrogenase family)